MTALERLLGHCRICDETGCWEWTGGMGGKEKTTPIFHFPGSRQNRRCMAAYKAAWLLSGREIPAGHLVYRACLNLKCVNPEHCKTGTHKSMWRHIAKSGKHKGHNRALIARKSNERQLTPVSTVIEIERLLGAGARRADISAATGVCECTVTAVKLGRHFHSSRRPKVVRGASVFAL